MDSLHNKEFQINFRTDNVLGNHLHQDIELLYVMEGEIELQLLDKVFTLKNEDFVIINSNHRHSWRSKQEVAVCEIHFDYAMMMNYLDKKLMILHCNSSIEDDDRYDFIRSQLSRLISECAVNADKMTFNKKSLIYGLLDYLVRYFMVDETSGVLEKDDIRVEKMLQYVNANYNRSISLQEMADFMYMAPSSFSRFFKKTVGTNFIEYVNQLRLHFALQDLCYTNNSITWISEAHGFTNASAFCRVFKDEYGESPMSYRKKFDEKENTDQKENKDIRKYLKKYTEKNQAQVSVGWKSDTVRIEENALQFGTWNNPWNKAMNLGFSYDLLSFIIQKQVTQAKKDLGFQAGRICAIFSEKLMLRQGHNMHITNYAFLDIIFDFMVEQGIRPIIGIDNKQESIIKDANNIFFESPMEIPFENMEEMLSVLDDFLIHIIERYGMREVSKWIFECWYDTYTGTFLGMSVDFVDTFEQVRTKIKEKIPDAAVGGWGAVVMDANNEHFLDITLKKWHEKNFAPDFVSLNLFPYESADPSEKIIRSKRLLNTADYYKISVDTCRKKMDENGFGHLPIYVAEWNTSISKRNFFNETCGKAALMLQLMAEINVKVEYAGYKELSDLSGIYYDTSDYLFGGMGVFNVYGAKKPSYYALTFMNQLNSYLIYKDKYTIITTDGYDSYTIVCFNAKRLKYKYYTKSEDGIPIDEIGDIFEDGKNLEITFCLNHVKNGTYNIKEYSVRPNHGSVMNEWIRLGKNEHLDAEDYEYLKNISRPVKRRGHVNVDQGKMILLQTLRANEICLLKISK